jgi:anti-anti-sigma regulatory factor
MDMRYKIICQAHPADRCVTLLLNGKFDEDAIPELEQSIRDANSAQQRVLLDLSEVTLVDRKAVQFFSDRASQGVKLVNCPIYLRRWIAQESDET